MRWKYPTPEKIEKRRLYLRMRGRTKKRREWMRAYHLRRKSDPKNVERIRANIKRWLNTPKGMAWKISYNRSPKMKETRKKYSLLYNKRPEVRERRRIKMSLWRMTPEGHARNKANTRNHRHIRRSLQKDTDVTTSWLIELHRMANNCPLCGCEYLDKNYHPQKKSIDHIVPIGMGGKHRKDNLRIICLRCNQSRPKNGSDIKTEDADAETQASQQKTLFEAQTAPGESPDSPPSQRQGTRT